MENIYIEVDFFTFCPKCKNKDLDAVSEPCNSCLEYPMLENSSKPMFYEENIKNIKEN